MAQMLLASKGFNQDMKKTFLSLLDEDIENSRATIITTASPHKENNKHAQAAKKELSQMGFHVTFTDVEYNNPICLEGNKVIYINGGNPFTLLFHLRTSGAGEIIKALSSEKVIFIGVSAGALVLGPDIKIVSLFTPQLNTVGIEDLTSLKLTEQYLFPHYDRDDLFLEQQNRTIEDRIREFEIINNCSVRRMTDEQYVLLESR
ncbi:Type 1 glutamine amidotransferase-like domain-containing protein [Paenibacillus sp. D9]|uniref:Type 1 glutamine amidotransferase-like domain-containing protein n=1 Tax=Paenibacillus TaxID=44249 RepID=UPI00061F2C96|nr:Type 1 glutamine amidotransferase-like domain-containing protein [Paenibacillus sp. D9]KKC49497.1 peptidase E [Paenibacillus sp. D9]